MDVVIGLILMIGRDNRNEKESLAAIAKPLLKHVVGEKQTQTMEMLKYYPENDRTNSKTAGAVRLFTIAAEARINLPLGTHKTARKGDFRWFTGVIAWFGGRRLKLHT